jgi:LysM repeat protein
MIGSRNKIAIASLGLLAVLLFALSHQGFLGVSTSSAYSETYCGGAWTYTVHSGDTIKSVTSWFEVSAAVVERINGLNPPYTLHSGESLLIPNCGNKDSYTYIVQSGDTLYEIGVAHGVSWQAIANASLVYYPYTIFVGEVLLIPGSSQSGDSIAVNHPCNWWWGCITNNYDSLILKYSSQNDIRDPMVIKAEMALESGYNTKAESWNSYCKSYDIGLMQIDAKCNNLNATELFYPYYNIEHSTQIWASIYSSLVAKWGSGCSFENLVKGTLEVYNRGSSGAGSYCGSFPDGTDYANNVIYYYFQFTNDSSYHPKF